MNILQFMIFNMHFYFRYVVAVLFKSKVWQGTFRYGSPSSGGLSTKLWKAKTPFSFQRLALALGLPVCKCPFCLYCSFCSLPQLLPLLVYCFVFRRARWPWLTYPFFVQRLSLQWVSLQGMSGHTLCHSHFSLNLSVFLSIYLLIDRDLGAMSLCSKWAELRCPLIHYHHYQVVLRF